MSLSDLASLGSLISGLAVLASLIYLNIQTRQSAKHQRFLMMQGRAARKMETQYRRADPSLAQGFEKLAAGRPEALSNFELNQIISDAAANFTSLEETWLEAQEGLQQKATQDVMMRSLAFVFSMATYRATWSLVRTMSDPEFAMVADRVMQETKCTLLAPDFDALRRALADEMASARA